MTKNSTKVYSAEELNTLQEKYIAGETLSKEELIAISVNKESDFPSTPETEKAPVAAGNSDIKQLADLLADVLESRGNSTIKGGKPFVPASPEEVAKRKKLTMEEKAKEYFDSVDLANFPWPGIHVTSDLMIFMGHVQGENARDNHMRENPGMKFESFPKPQ